MWPAIATCDQQFPPVTSSFHLWPAVSTCDHQVPPVTIRCHLWPGHHSPWKLCFRSRRRWTWRRPWSSCPSADQRRAPSRTRWTASGPASEASSAPATPQGGQFFFYTFSFFFVLGRSRTVLGGGAEYGTGNRIIGLIGRTSQCGPFGPLFHFLCDIPTFTR